MQKLFANLLKRRHLYRHLLGAAMGISLAGTAPSYAADELGNLALFKGGAMQAGQWRMELLSSSDSAMQAAMAKMGKMSICVDIAKQLAKNAGTQQSDCSTKILRNTVDAAEVDASCPSGTHSHMLMSRESKDSYLIDVTITTGKDAAPRDFKARYIYEGACKGDALIQIDKNSEACQKMQGVDLSALCAKSPEQYRAQCEQQMKQMQAMCQ